MIKHFSYFFTIKKKQIACAYTLFIPIGIVGNFFIKFVKL